jgi:hypothetical protein
LSIHDIPDFPAIDMSSGEATTPYRGFGGVIQDSTGPERRMAYFVRGVGHELVEKGLLTPEMKERLPRADR